MTCLDAPFGEGRRCRPRAPFGSRPGAGGWDLGPRSSLLNVTADRRYVATRPPSTARVTPCTKLASSLARKTIAAASSSGSATRPAGARAASCFTISTPIVLTHVPVSDDVDRSRAYYTEGRPVRALSISDPDQILLELCCFDLFVVLTRMNRGTARLLSSTDEQANEQSDERLRQRLRLGPRR